jgi:hypothetical protein
MNRKQRDFIINVLSFIAFFSLMAFSATMTSNDSKFTSSSLIIIIVFLVSILSVLIIAIQYKRKENKLRNLKYLKTCQENVYGHYDKITHNFKTLIDIPYNSTALIQRDYFKKFEKFLIVLTKHSRLYPVQKNHFESLSSSSGQFYDCVYIFLLDYLIEHKIDQFKRYFTIFKNNIDYRIEKRILHEKLHRIHFLNDYYDIPIDLLEMAYDFYQLQEDVDKKIKSYKPTCKLDEVFYIIILYQYLMETEQHAFRKDLENEYQQVLTIKSKL